MADYICPYLCSYKTNSGFCGYTGGHNACQYRKIVGFSHETKQFYAVPVGSYEEAHDLMPITNYDKLTHKTPEELAVVLAWPYLASPPWCAEHITCPHVSEDPTPCDKYALDWLKQEAEEGE